MIQIRRIKGSQNVHERKRWTQKTTLKEQKNLNPNVTYDTNRINPKMASKIPGSQNISLALYLSQKLPGIRTINKSTKKFAHRRH